MALSKRTYTANETKITATNMNDIQDEIIQNASDISGLQSKSDNTLNTTDKTIVGAINELYSMITALGGA